MNPTLTVPVANNFQNIISPSSVFSLGANFILFILIVIVAGVCISSVIKELLTHFSSPKDATLNTKKITGLLTMLTVAIVLVSIVAFVIGNQGDNLVSIMNTMQDLTYKTIGGAKPIPLTNPLK